MVYVTYVCLRDVITTIFVILYLNVNHLGLCFSCFEGFCSESTSLSLRFYASACEENMAATPRVSFSRGILMVTLQ